ncbi:MAG: hypothetical protein ACI4WU_03355 [Bacilli bacterium]
MVSYNNSNVVQYLRQYEMFSNSLKLVRNREEREMIIKQLTKLEYKIIEITNESYEEEYYTLANKECSLLDEEKKRVSMLIDLINQRLTYVEKRCNDHYQLTGETLDVNDVLGANTLDTLENRVKIIDKYSKNVKLKEELENEVKSLSSKISLASEKIDINKGLNIELESQFKSLLTDAFEKNGLYDLLELKDEIEFAYYETEKSLTLAELNLETAKTSPMNVLNDCQTMLQNVKQDYIKYKDRLSLLRLMEIFNREVNTYDELLKKRKEVNELLKYIKNEDFINMIIDTVSKQYNTILMEQQDINTFNDLTLEKERKLEVLSEIDEENNSEEFQSVLKVLIENEKKRQEKILEEKRKALEEEKKRKIEIEKKRQEEILKRQKIIEEARKKEIEKRTKQLLEQQQNSVLSTKKKEKNYSFESIKDNINEDTLVNEESDKLELRMDRNKMLFENKIEDDDNFNLEIDRGREEETMDSDTLFKNKSDIEKELFDEFNSNDNNKEIDSDRLFNNKLLDEKEEVKENKFPDMSIDEYMKNFDENSVSESSSFFGSDDVFPSIPM